VAKERGQKDESLSTKYNKANYVESKLSNNKKKNEMNSGISRG
jgi:hypothetical protein